MDQAFQRFKTNIMQDKAHIFKHCIRIIRCIIDCQQELQDAICVLNALQLARCLEGKVWENSPGEIRQLEGVGPASVRKLVIAGVRSLSKLATLQPHQIETALSRNPPFGTNILKAVKCIPQFKLSSKQVGPAKVCYIAQFPVSGKCLIEQ
jgi:ATP-dependent DNA helicase HFM1/MER3